VVLVLLVAGLLFVWLATEAGWFGLSSESVNDLPMGLMVAVLAVLLVAWLWRRRAKWH
jgi:MYXO-CTERM domain-containing protein